MTEKKMTNKVQIVCGWCGIATILVMIVGMGPIGHVTPPPSPLVGADEMATFFKQNATGVILGSFFINIGVALSIALVAGISAQIRRMESSGARVLSYLQLASGTTASLFVMLPAMILSVAAYRPEERSAETLLMLHYLATFTTFMPFSVATLENVAIAAAIFSDRSPKPAFPRWLGYFNLLAGLSYVPMGLLGFFKSGPLASNGLLGWWVPTVIVAIWYVVMGLYLIKAQQPLLASDSDYAPGAR